MSPTAKTKPFVNRQRVDVPESLAPLTGYVIVPIVITPKEFHEFWSLVRAQDNEEDDSRHEILKTYETRLPLIREASLLLDGQLLTLPKSADDLVDQAIAPFIVGATQECVRRATRIPSLPGPSKNTGAA